MTTANQGYVKGKSPLEERNELVSSPSGVQARMPAIKGNDGNLSAGQIEGSVDAIRSAIESKDAEQVVSLLASANKSVLDAIGANSSLIEKLQDLPVTERNAAYDYLHLSITDADLLVDIIYQRFGVMLLGKNQHTGDAKKHLKSKKSDNAFATNKDIDNDVDFSAAHAQQIYSGYMCVPQSALDKIVFVFSETNNVDGVGYDQGYAMTPRNNICLNSQAGLEDERNAVNTGMGGMGGMFAEASGAGNVSSDKDAAFNTVFRQWTAIHELGHVIDAEGSYSPSADFRACSGWNEFDNAEDVVNNELLKNGNVENPYLDDFSDEEKEVANKVAIELAKTNDLNAAQKIVSKNKSKLTHYSKEEFEELIEDSHESWSDADGMNLFKAASLTKKDEVWYEMKGYVWMDKHMKRPTHYHKEAWWSYDRDTRKAGKISAYQYAFPKEDFAEAYACYYYTEILDQKEKTNNPMPAKLKAWFDAHKKELEEL